MQMLLFSSGQDNSNKIGNVATEEKLVRRFSASEILPVDI